MPIKNECLNLLDEELIRLSDLAAHLPWKPTRCTVRNWTKTGFRGTKLESIKVGNVTMTSKQASERFFVRINLGIEVTWKDERLAIGECRRLRLQA